MSASTYNQDNSNTTVEGKQKGISITPSFGIAIKNNLVAGIMFSYSNANQKNFINSGDYDNHGLGAGVFVRKFILLLKSFTSLVKVI